MRRLFRLIELNRERGHVLQLGEKGFSIAVFRFYIALNIFLLHPLFSY